MSDLLWTLLIYIPLFATALVAQILVHELGHYVMARAARVPVRELQLGGGRPVATWTWGATQVALGRGLTSGGHVTTSARNGDEVRVGLITVAGSAVNMASAVYVLTTSLPIPVVSVVVLTAGMAVAAALFPVPGSDGWILWQLAKGRSLESLRGELA